MSNPTVENVVIIGTGCAGLTAAVYTARATSRGSPRASTASS